MHSKVELTRNIILELLRDKCFHRIIILCIVSGALLMGFQPNVFAIPKNAGIYCTVKDSVAPSDVVNIGTRLELFLDNYLIEKLAGKADLRLHHPEPTEDVLINDAPWEGSGCGYVSIFKDGDIYRMYYESWQLTVDENGVRTDSHPLWTCYAESNDGIHWRKPKLGLFEFQGSKANNIVLTSDKIGNVSADGGHPAVFKDENPDASPDAKYKAFRLSNGVIPFKSSDGIHWLPMSNVPVITNGAFDSQNLAFWDGVNGEYRAYWRYFTGGVTPMPYDPKTWLPSGVRAIRTATSKDFLHWENQSDLKYEDSPSEELYTSQVKPYYRAPHLLIGFPARYVDRGTWSESTRALPDRENREWRGKTARRYGTVVTESLLMASRDGVTFKRWNEAFLRPGIERPGTWAYGNQYIGWSMVETKSAFDGAPNELSFYATESYWTGTSDVIRRYTLRVDGFVSVNAPMSGGELITKPLRFTGNELMLNFSSSAAGGIQVEIQDETGKALPGFSLDDCPVIFGDTIERVVNWKNGSDVSALEGKPVRLRFVLKDADLFSFRFK